MSAHAEIKPNPESYALAETSTCRAMAEAAKAASRRLAITRGETRNTWLRKCAASLLDRRHEVLAANARDISEAETAGLSPAAIERLSLSDRRLDDMAQSLLDVAALPDPIGEVVTASRRPN